MTRFAVVRDNMFVENMFASKEEADQYMRRCENIFPSHKFDIRNAQIETIRPFLDKVTLGIRA
jgi:hypothetical protein